MIGGMAAEMIGGTTGAVMTAVEMTVGATTTEETATQGMIIATATPLRPLRQRHRRHHRRLLNSALRRRSAGALRLLGRSSVAHLQDPVLPLLLRQL